MEELKFEIIRKLLMEGDEGREELLQIVEDTHPADLADILEQLSEEERSSVVLHGFREPRVRRLPW